jgi:hypothetical protein
MAKFTPNGLEAYLQDVTDIGTAPTPMLVVGITAANPVTVELSVTDIANLAVGDIVSFADTTTPLDGNSYIVTDVASPDFTLGGVDGTAFTVPATVVGSVVEVPQEQMLRFCLSGYEREIAAADAIDVTTFCEAGSLAGTPLPGTINIEGFIDYQVEAYNEWRKGVADGLQRNFLIKLPTQVGGQILMTITPSGLTETFAVNEAASFTGTAVINKEPLYILP